MVKNIIFIIQYRLNGHWFNRFSQIDGFSTLKEAKEYIKKARKDRTWYKDKKFRIVKHITEIININ